MTVMILSHITATEEKSVFFSVHKKKYWVPDFESYMNTKSG